MALRWSLVTFARSERAALCDLLDEVGPHAPTLCEGWDTHDLAAHVWVRETDPIGASGIVAKRGSALISASVTGRLSAFPAASSTTTSEPFRSLGSG